jgi:hypothetical protein
MEKWLLPVTTPLPDCAAALPEKTGMTRMETQAIIASMVNAECFGTIADPHRV